MSSPTYLSLAAAWGTTGNTDSSSSSTCFKISSEQVKAFSKWISDADREYLRLRNIKPTTEGIANASRCYDHLVATIKALPGLLARFDRRIPCWRSTRWKSLT